MLLQVMLTILWLQLSLGCPNDICYKLLVYDNNGNYVAERDYIRGKESNTAITPALMLDGGQTYTFVAYCINTTTIASLPSVVNKIHWQVLH